MDATVSNMSVDSKQDCIVCAMIEAAKRAPEDEQGFMLWSAQNRAKEVLPTYILLYKFHTRRGEFEAALHAAQLGLAEAGRQAGLPTEIAEEACGLLIPEHVSFEENGAARFWLFMLKALVSASTQLGKTENARRYRDVLECCDPDFSNVGTLPLDPATTPSTEVRCR